MAGTATNATAEVNEFRAKKGLAPFKEDPCLVQAAMTIAEQRAGAHRAGHTRNDFSGLPEGCKADAAGCAAMTPDWGWHSCCDSEDWEYGGAAVVMGDDGQRYMQLFVRGEGGRRRHHFFGSEGLVPHAGKCFDEDTAV